MNSIAKLLLVTFLFVSIQCKTDKSVPKDDAILKIQLKSDPQKLHPMVSPTSLAREVYQYIFLPLAEFHPTTLELEPILIKEVNDGTSIEEGPYKGGIRFSFELREDAKWSDGEPVKVEDYAFTVKAANHPKVNAPGWRTYLKEISEVVQDVENPRKFDVIMAKDYMLAKETAVTIQVYPSHIYDPKGILKDISIEDLKSESVYANLEAKDSSLIQFAQEFNSTKFTRETVVGCGPYALAEWESDQYLVLENQKEYWGDQYPDNPFLQSFPRQIQFQIIKDPTSALTLLKSGELDVLNNISSINFKELKEDIDFKDQFEYFSPSLIRYLYIGLNNRREGLSDKTVRRALAHLIDVDGIIKTLEYGLGQRTVGHFNPNKSYYNNSLDLIDYNLDKANQLLDDSGWKDSDGNGIRDKEIDGKQVELSFEILISKAELGRKVSLMFQESAAKAGVKIDLIQKQYRVILSDHLQKHDFDMATLVNTADAAPVDAFDKWHSSNRIIGRNNYFGLNNLEADELMEKIRLEKNKESRNQLYFKLQEIMYEEQPVIFLYCPVEKIAVSKKFKGSGTSKRPGYLANTFQAVFSEAFSEN